MPLLSILMPMKNGSPFIAETIHSILQQGFSDWELIIVDDFSTDNSVEIVKSFGSNNISIIENEVPGIVNALILALSHATGTYITRMDSDDLMPVKRLSKMTETIKNCHPKTVVTGLVMYFSKHEISKGYGKYEKWINSINLEGSQQKNIYRECVIASPNWICKRSELMETGGFSGLCYPEDYDLVFRWYQNKFNFNCIPEITLLWREHEERTSRISPHYNQEAFFHLKITRFLQLDHHKEKTIMVWGNNRKAKLTTGLLKTAGVKFEKVKLKSNINDLAFGKIEQIKNVQILIAVYPRENEKQIITNYLQSEGLEEAVDFWYL